MTQGIQAKRVLGIDPGLNITGYGVVQLDTLGQLVVVEAGVLRSGASRDLGQRLLHLSDGITDVISSLRPAVVALEELFSHYQRPRTAILMGHARGVLCAAAARAQLGIYHYSATQVKRVLTGNGRAAKSQVQSAVTKQLDLAEIPEPPDVADALAVALCHCFLAEIRPVPRMTQR